ncbi:hypothetical protein PIIN_08922 [Serendipita indica DSM 11827]|uniref:Uncharacterized protein n=1 Tax=Serendipita indica (strain DSM 11827) TaxID=1109443 RepID=G4TUE9_SERID|nr:hypothetical protein PIIN_08922 [Serendipita indica DSM 11827]
MSSTETVNRVEHDEPMANATNDSRALSDEVEGTYDAPSPPVSVLDTDPRRPSGTTDMLDFEGDGALSDSDSAWEPGSTPDLVYPSSLDTASAASTSPPSTPASPIYYPAPVSANGTGTPPPWTPPTGSLSPVSDMWSEDDDESFGEDIVEGAIHRLSAMTNAASED